MKQVKLLKKTLIILIILLLSLISFEGLYVNHLNTVKNVLPDYILGSDLAGTRTMRIKVNEGTQTINYDENGKVIDSSDTQTTVSNSEEKKINSEEAITSENYLKSKEIVEKRLASMGVKDYKISLNNEDGTMILAIPENDKTDLIAGELEYQGKFELLDEETNEVLMDNNDLKSVKAGYGTTSSNTTSVFVNIQFNKEGTNKFKDITNKYTQTTEAKTEDSNENVIEAEEASQEETDKQETQTVTKKIAIKVDGTTLLTTYFDSEISNGLLQLSVGSSTSATTQELQDSLKQANNMASLLDSGKMPIVYQVDQNRFISSDISQENIAIIISVLIVIAVIGMIFLIIKYKKEGILASISLIGFVALFLIVVRYANVSISISGIVGIVLAIVINYVFLIKLLSSIKKQDEDKILLKQLYKYLLIIIPALIISISLTVVEISIGTVLFWGLIISLLYNLIFTKLLLD